MRESCALCGFEIIEVLCEAWLIFDSLHQTTWEDMVGRCGKHVCGGVYQPVT